MKTLLVLCTEPARWARRWVCSLDLTSHNSMQGGHVHGLGGTVGAQGK